MIRKVVVFDLDDTLYKEIDFLKSGYRKVAELVAKRFGYDAVAIYDQLLSWYDEGENAFACLNETYAIDNPIEDYLNVYRYHHPSITLSQDVKDVLTALKKAGHELGIITDGREISQKQKVAALGLNEWIPEENVFINEEKRYFKPNHWSFDRMMLRSHEQYPEEELFFYYVGDNPEKDFIAPNQLGWTSVCLLDDGKNIHKQDFNCEEIKLPKRKIANMSELIEFV